jgi:four helix bundle protein
MRFQAPPTTKSVFGPSERRLFIFRTPSAWENGTANAAPGTMNTAHRYEDLVCWQLADELEKLVFELTEEGPASRDFKFRDQIRDSSSSATRNIAEGFGRFWPAEHAQFLRIAKASLMETHSSARTGLNRGYFSTQNTDRMQRLCGRSGKAATGLIRYLESLVPKSQRRKQNWRTRGTSGTSGTPGTPGTPGTS